MIEILNNPKTNLYFGVKTLILSEDFYWNYNYSTSNNDHIPFFGHCLLRRPEDTPIKFSKELSPHTEIVSKCLLEILDFNNININTFFRINVNMVLPTKVKKYTSRHVDHPFFHHNMIVYLTNSGGKLFAGEDEHDPKEDGIVMFEGNLEHCIQTPLKERRVAIVSTFYKAD